jgi:PBP1b-binding outer membrane lipoprotein LpoB
MKYIFSLLMLAFLFTACRKEKVQKAQPSAAEDIRVMVYATNGSDTTPVASTTILRLNLK